MSGSVFARDDTMFGVCEALGEDFGFNPNILRVLFGIGLLWGPATAIALYAGCGLLVAASRWLVPEPRAISVPSVDASVGRDGVNDQGRAWEDVALAA